MGEPPPRQPFSHAKFYLLPPIPPATKEKKTKTTHLGKPGSKNILFRILVPQVSFSIPPRTNDNKESQKEEENRSEPLISSVSLLGGTSSLFGIILLDASLQWSVRFSHVPGTSRTLFLEAWRDGVNETKMGELLSITKKRKKEKRNVFEGG